MLGDLELMLIEVMRKVQLARANSVARYAGLGSNSDSNPGLTPGATNMPPAPQAC